MSLYMYEKLGCLVIQWLLILPCFLAVWLADHLAGQRHPARWIQLLNKTENAPWPKLSQNSQKTSESYKTRGNASDKIRDRLIFREILDEFSDNFRKIWKSTENLRKMTLD